MTFCVGIKVRGGLVGLADTRITSGSEIISARKISVFQDEDRCFFVMTSGLRSLRDKTMAYFEEALEEKGASLTRLFRVLNVFSEQLRQVAQEDKAVLEDSGLHFNIHAMIGGQCREDKEPRLYMVYPQANWVEIGEGTPYNIIGAGGYGKPVLDRTLTYEDTVRFALKVGCLAFDSTRISAADVDFPIDVALYSTGAFTMTTRRFEKEDLKDMTTWWQERLRASVKELPADPLDDLVAQMPPPSEA